MTLQKSNNLELKKSIKLFALVILVITLSAPAAFAADTASKQKVEKRIDKLFSKLKILKKKRTVPVDADVTTLSGKKVPLSQFYGKLTLVNLWATWCPDCDAEMPLLERLYQKLKDKGFMILAVDLQEPASTVARYFKKRGLSFTPLLDIRGNFGRRLGIRVIPSTLILDSKGRLIGVAFGAREWDSPDAVELMNLLLEQE